MGTDLVGLPPPALDEDRGFQQGVEAFPIETRVAQRAGEGFPRAVLPGAARCNEARGHADPRQPVADRGGGARWAVVGAEGGRWAPRDEARGEAGQSVVAAPPPGDVAAEALPACTRPRWPATGGAARLRSGRRRRRRTRHGGGGRSARRRITAFLRQEGGRVHHKRVERLWRHEGLPRAGTVEERADPGCRTLAVIVPVASERCMGVRGAEGRAISPIAAAIVPISLTVGVCDPGRC